MARKFFNTRNINKAVYLVGLTPMQLILLFVGAVLLALIAIITKTFVLLTLLLLVIWLANKISKENRKGNPDYLNEFFVWTSINTFTNKRYVLDDKGVFKKLKAKRNED